MPTLKTPRPRAKITLIIGPLASGKSTIARSLSSLDGSPIFDNYHPTRGEERSVARKKFMDALESSVSVIVCAENYCRPWSFPADRVITIGLGGVARSKHSRR